MVAFIQWDSRIPWKNIWKVDEISIETVKPLVILMEYLSFALVLELCSSVFFVCFHSSNFFLCTCSLFYLGEKKKKEEDLDSVLFLNSYREKEKSIFNVFPLCISLLLILS